MKKIICDYDMVLTNAREKFKRFSLYDNELGVEFNLFAAAVSEFVQDEINIRDLEELQNKILYTMAQAYDGFISKNNMEEYIEFNNDIEIAFFNKLIGLPIFEDYCKKGGFNSVYHTISLEFYEIVMRIASKEFSDTFIDYMDFLHNSDKLNNKNICLYMQAVADFWIDAINNKKAHQSNIINNGKNKLTNEEENIFRNEMYSYLKDNCYDTLPGAVELSVKHFPSQILKNIGSKIGLREYLDYPLNTYMIVFPSMVIVTDLSNLQKDIIYVRDNYKEPNFNPVVDPPEESRTKRKYIVRRKK